MTTTRHIEIDGAIAHPLCQKRGTEPPRAQAVYIADVRPYADDTARAQQHIDYAIANGITHPMMRVDMGPTFGGVSIEDNCPAYAQPTVEDLVRGYATGCLDYRKAVATGGWAGCEFDRFCTVAKMYAEANLKPVLLFDLLGEATADMWATDPMYDTGRRMARVLDGLKTHGLARSRGFPHTLGTPVQDWAKVYTYTRAVTNTTCHRIVEDSPLRGSAFIVSGSCGVEVVREDGRIQPPCRLAPNQISHGGYYGRGEAITAACIDAKHRHRMESETYAVNLSLQDALSSVLLRDRFGAGEYSILWGDPSELSTLEAAMAAWSN